MLQLREKEIFETLKRMGKFKFVIIGGYAVNAYTLPRFSVDCDIVVKDKEELMEIEEVLVDFGYAREENNKDNASYYGDFLRLEKDLGDNIKVSIDILIKEVLDRQTNATFSADWVFNNSEIRTLRGKTITEELKLRIINLDALFVLKFVSCRLTDIRDIFMLAPNIKNKKWVKEEISKKYDFNRLYLKIKEKITSKQFKDTLQGVYGIIDDKVFEKHKKAILDLQKI
ncbi:nucleotidyl transferase AbiEii/AbiGii toxin family protein [Candidatus Pacearchaeota archaeon]|nr:nucleotidyl transferase AbiEii/AbiGii toxin family protein [Candidatus Pacearchaeota archaeon]